MTHWGLNAVKQTNNINNINHIKKNTAMLFVVRMCLLYSLKRVKTYQTQRMTLVWN